MLAAARTHLSARGQPHTLTAHFEYPSRTSPGPAVVTVEDVKLSGQLSTLHLTLWQGALAARAPWVTPASRRIVLAYATHTDLRAFAGITLPTGFEGTPAAELPPLPDFGALSKGGPRGAADAMWEESKLPAPARAAARSLQNWRFYVAREGPLTPGVLDMWICLASGERITQDALAYVVDSFPVSSFWILDMFMAWQLMNCSASFPHDTFLSAPFFGTDSDDSVQSARVPGCA